MGKIITLIACFFAACLTTTAQSGVVVTSITSSGSGGSFSSSAGELFTGVLSGPGGTGSTTVQSSSVSTLSTSMYSGNGQSGFGGPFGNSTMDISDNGTTVSITINPAGDLTTNFIVFYIDNRTSGRAVIDGTDGNDAGRRAISNANSGNITFPTGFEASFGISIDANFGGLFSIPATGSAITNGSLSFVDGVGSSDGANTFTISFDWSEIGLTSADSFDFVATYGNPNDGSVNMFSSNEGYGGGIENGGSNNALGAMAFTSSLTYVGSRAPITTTASASDWSNPASWNAGKVPSSNNAIIIAHDINVDTNITIDNSLTVNPTVLLNLNAGNIITNNGTIIFDSDATGSAQFTNGAESSIVGDVTVNRFIPAATSGRRAYRFVASSVNTTTSIYQNWQTGGANEPGVGTHITGSASGSNGFDATSSGNPSLLEYINDGNGYQWKFVNATDDPNTTNDNLIAGKAYNIFIRGDRNYNFSGDGIPNSNTVLPSIGTLNLAQAVSSSALNPAAGGFDFVGNPYQATLDMTIVTKNGINPNFMYIWDPNAASQGAYQTIDISAGSTDPKRFIEPGQSFFVVNNSTGGPANIEFISAAKTPQATNAGTFSTNNPRPKMTIELWGNNSNPFRYDTAVLKFDGENFVNMMDAPKIWNFEENFSINKNGTLLSIENRAMPTDGEVILFDFSNVGKTDFELRISLEHLGINLSTSLVDRFLNTETTLNSDGVTVIPFTVDFTNANSFSNDRFSIRFGKSTLSNDRINNLTFSMYPNPTRDFIEVQLGSGYENGEIIFYNLLGQQVKAVKNVSNKSQIGITDLERGVYLVKVISENKEVTQKLIKK